MQALKYTCVNQGLGAVNLRLSMLLNHCGRPYGSWLHAEFDAALSLHKFSVLEQQNVLTNRQLCGFGQSRKEARSEPKEAALPLCH